MLHALAEFIQFLIDAFVKLLDFVALLFPPSPFSISSTGFGDILSKINYFIPVYEFIAIGQAWLVAIGVYYAISAMARWAKAIE